MIVESAVGLGLGLCAVGLSVVGLCLVGSKVVGIPVAGFSEVGDMEVGWNVGLVVGFWDVDAIIVDNKGLLDGLFVGS